VTKERSVELGIYAAPSRAPRAPAKGAWECLQPIDTAPWAPCSRSGYWYIILSYTIPNSELGYYVPSQIPGWDIMCHLKTRARVLCTIPGYVLVYSRPKFGVVAQDSGSRLAGTCDVMKPHLHSRASLSGACELSTGAPKWPNRVIIVIVIRMDINPCKQVV